MKQKAMMSFNKQSGVTLIVGLIMVLLLTIIGLAAIRGSNMQEMMAGNARDRHVAFEAAEAALRDGESNLADGHTSIDDEIANNTTGFYEGVDTPSRYYWLGKDAGGAFTPFDWDTEAATYGGTLENVNEQPKYAVEKLDYLEPGMDGSAAGFMSVQEQESRVMFRVTARGEGANENTVVVLQTTYR
ncbi:pilus assembly PilX family protein [Gilvimarinus xylanilyticus]|uniref:PilX N-terminal domain-containing pilus assembly protein n=1 Tax=Gilvimarinus xylanilyticus TaxID=2944139 RepID=A0A9X2I4Q9_9GAMM|nr:PilX N-terminal domain-containing pilus assembly protein [Gilvimarinus xylanilyticus]MCP8900320.1 PilX N-terminal domain-containing pilus assembly protein [Gilvimarinus xylanilyticus]